jgi:hypothetical protein
MQPSHKANQGMKKGHQKTGLAPGRKAFLWGSGKDGRCGNGKDSSEKVPNAVTSQHKFMQLSCGYHHSAAVS